MALRQLRPEEYTVAWVCALPCELAAAQVMLDEKHKPVEDGSTIYTLGRVGEHNVVIAGLPAGQTGTVSAAVVAERIIKAFTSIRIGLMVGIGGGVPGVGADIRLGDVVISKPHGAHGGVVQYDLGKTTPSEFKRTGFLNAPPRILLNAVANLQANHLRGLYRLPEYLSRFSRLPTFAREGAGPDILFEAEYNHESGATCEGCSGDRLMCREPRVQEVAVHYGTVASGNQVMRAGAERDRVSAELGGVLCFEMEAAGLMNSFPCLVIRGICDYADSHKNKKWQAYAAGTAAACAKEVLSVIPADKVEQARKAEFLMASHTFMPLLYENACIYEESKTRNRPRVPGTCEWFTSHALFERWTSQPNNEGPGLLYVTADPGCGKSVLSRYLIDDILPKNDRTVCFFFFKEDFERQWSSLSAICSLLHQLFVPNRRLLTDDMLQKYIDRGKGFFESFDNLWGTFILAAGGQDTVCVLDALDECQDKDRRQLIKAIATTCNSRSSETTEHSGPKFLLTSRPYEHIRAQISLQLESPMAMIHLQGDQGPSANAIAQEIQLVLDARIDETAEFFCLEDDERILMRTQLESVSNRTYLWITLVFDGLLDRKLGLSKGDIMSLLREPPQTVYDAYEEILNKSPDLEEAKRLLYVIVGAERPLSIAEMSVALAFKDDESSALVSERIIPVSRVTAHIRGLCGFFAIIVDNNVYLLHQTAREFLLRNKVDIAPQRPQHKPIQTGNIVTYTWRHSMVVTESHKVLAEICIFFLRSRFSSEHSSFLEYAAIYWATHYRQSPDTCQVDMANMARELLLPSGGLWRWIGIYNIYNGALEYRSALGHASAMGLKKIAKLLLLEQYSDGVNSETEEWLRTYQNRLLSKTRRSFKVRLDRQYRNDLQSALHLAARNGHEAVVKLLLLERAEVNSKDVHYHLTPLWIAAANGREAVVKLLLQKGANAGLTCRDQTPLSRAAKNGHQAVVELLLQKAAHVKFKNIVDENEPLWCAVENGHGAIVKLLLRNGADVGLRRGGGSMLLLRAAKNGHEPIVRLLLQTSQAEVNFRDSPDGQTALWYAAAGGHAAAAEVLLRTGQADVNSRDKGNGQTPLDISAAKGHAAMVKLLLDLGRADVNSRNHLNGRTPLWCAAAEGREAVVKLLLESAEVEVNCTDYIYAVTPLWYASSAGRRAVVKLLLAEDKTNVNWKDGYYRQTVLGCAVNNRNEGMVKLLLDSGRINVNSKDKNGRTPLINAAVYGSRGIVKLLLKARGVDVDCEDRQGRTPLSCAAVKGDEAMVKLMLEDGQADPNAKDEYGRMPLSHAAEVGSEAVAKLLLETGRVDANLMDDYYCRTPLSYAAAKGHEVVVKLLLEDGQVNVDLTDEYCRSPLSYAAENGHKSAANLLLEMGHASVDLKDVFDRTPLSYAVDNNHEAVVELLRSIESP